MRRTNDDSPGTYDCDCRAIMTRRFFVMGDGFLLM